ncbi:hypothetical protein HRG_009427 [Hirsutella rhossiliensis]|uniref:Uncharacterized protein n=1 Tax=Hirsutella rhossiliensis TaxID=111463 RepID=A0A9P8SFP3_9HYPO|nr:uncharacterized protein HRG_09427 [Hirsutella rhossiliensis]KAH0959645.1 hypothetical protein HRG_09427 [Hirsutella rhossiliensis]
MKYTFVTVAALLASALAAPAIMVDERQMKAIEILHDNKNALGLSQDELNTFDKFMDSLHKRDTVADAPGGLGGLTDSLGSLTGGGKKGGKKGGLLGGVLIPGLL